MQRSAGKTEFREEPYKKDRRFTVKLRLTTFFNLELFISNAQ